MNPTVMMIFILALNAVVFHASPKLARSGIFFGVTAGREFPDSPEARRILWRYRLVVWAAALAGIALMLVFQRPAEVGLIAVFPIVGAMGAWAWANRTARRYATVPVASTVRSAVLTPRRESLPGGWLLALGPVLVLVAAAVYLGLHWDQVPERFPVHWGIDGQPDRWSAKSVGSVFLPLVIGTCVAGFLVWMATQMVYRTRQVAVGEAAVAGERRFKRMQVMVLLITSWLIAGLFSAIALQTVLPSRNGLGLAPWIPAVVFMGVAIIALAVSMRMGQGGTRLVHDPDELPVNDSTPDECWKLGQFYYNPNDPSLLVERRMGFGWTFNFANPKAWLLLVLAIGAPLLLPRLVG